MSIKYLTGFGNTFESEATPGSLPQTQNSPQRPPLSLYPEQLSGSAFTVARPEQRRSWMYRILPSVLHSPFEPFSVAGWSSGCTITSPNQKRWNPPAPSAQTAAIDFVQGLQPLAGNGSPTLGHGCTAGLFHFGKSMNENYLVNSDAEMILIPYQGTLELRTEFGKLEIAPLMIAVIPRGIKFQVVPLAAEVKGYFGENFGAPLRLPDLGPIGSNGLAQPRDFEYPTAWFEHSKGKAKLINKYQGQFFRAELPDSPLNVVAWHGNYAPYRYDLRKFNTLGTISYDHPDPSIFTVLTSPSSDHGIANLDFVIFPPRWMVAENTFRPPYYHRNIMSEFMGLLAGIYDAKETGFQLGGASLHNCMSAHGPDAEAFQKATGAELKPMKLENTMAFMFESRYPFQTNPLAETQSIQQDYWKVWQDLKPNYLNPKK